MYKVSYSEIGYLLFGPLSHNNCQEQHDVINGSNDTEQDYQSADPVVVSRPCRCISSNQPIWKERQVKHPSKLRKITKIKYRSVHIGEKKWLYKRMKKDPNDWNEIHIHVYKEVETSPAFVCCFHHDAILWSWNL